MVTLGCCKCPVKPFVFFQQCCSTDQALLQVEIVSSLFFDLTMTFGGSKYIVPFISWPPSHSIEADVDVRVIFKVPRKSVFPLRSHAYASSIGSTSTIVHLSAASITCPHFGKCTGSRRIIKMDARFHSNGANCTQTRDDGHLERPGRSNTCHCSPGRNVLVFETTRY